jgi:GNAT superfamily N-acetyltransferase
LTTALQGAARAIRHGSRPRCDNHPHVTALWLAGTDDVGTVAGLLAGFRDHLGHSEPSDDSLARSAELLVGRGDTEFWLAAAEDSSPAAGVCQLRFRHSVWTGADDCWLEDLFVREEARRHGLGRALVGRAVERARERGCRRIELDTTEDNHNAIRLYESLGFSAASKGTRGLFLGLRLDR